MRKFIRAVALIAVAGALGGCWNGPYERPATPYVQRTDTITLGAGNAKDVNAATHIIDPWPHRVGDRRIPANGERMVNAVDRYKGRSGPAGQQTGGQSTSTPSAGSTPPVGAATPSSTLPF